MIVHPLDAAPFLMRLGAGLFAAALIWLVAVDYGSLITARLLPAWSSYEKRVLGGVLGYACIGSAAALLGLMHALRSWLVVGLLVVAVLVRIPVYLPNARLAADASRRARAWLASLSSLQKLWLAATIVAILVGAVAAALPAVWWDPLAYHLPIVALALGHATFAFNPDIQQTAFPLLGEAAALPAYVIAGSAGAGMATLGAGFLLALVAGILADRISEGAGLLAAALVSCSALWLWLAPSFYIDIPLGLFSLASLTVVLLSRDDGTGEALLAGAFAGAAAATKYTGLFLILIVAFILVLRSRKKVAQGVAVIGGAAALALCWYVRTLLLTGDPVYPFLSAVLAHARMARATPSHTNVVQWFASATPHFCGGGISMSDALTLPVRMLTQPRSFCGDPGPALIAGFILFLAAPLLLRAARPWFWVTIALTLVWFFTAQQWRFLITALSIVAALAAATVQTLQPRLRLAVGALLAALCIFGVAVNLLPSFLMSASNSVVPGYRYIAGRQSASDYLRSRVDNFAAAAWLAQKDKEAKIFALDDVRDYYFGPNVAWGNSPYPGGLRVDWSATPQQRYRFLILSGYRYMVVNENPEYTHRTLANVDWSVLSADEKAGVIRQVFAENDVIVYRFAP
ncbi:MAG TPA: hypothetical protein VKR99_03875 [Candidatus Eremiobacteraceae bacterium]|nr:hypothetical protein [Candidatus Eremiobacteraceae bacterium]